MKIPCQGLLALISQMTKCRGTPYTETEEILLNQKCCNICGHMRATAWACAVGFKWQRGDLLALDNLTVLHGRLGFTGDKKILVYLNA